MTELELVRVDGDGRALVLRAPDGTEHALPVTEALTAAVASALARRPGDDAATEPSGASPVTTVPEPATAGTSGAPSHRPSHAPSASSAAAPSGAASAEPPHEPTLRPRDLQARLRAGATAEELAAEAGLPVENVRRYEWPVIAEREHVIAMVRAHEVPGIDSTAELGTVADARLSARGVNPPEATWSARREGTAPWVVEVKFWAGDRERSARWTFDQRGRLVTPLDDEARWLGQPDEPLTPQVRPVPTSPVPAIGSRRALPSADRGSGSRGSGSRGAGSWNGRDETDVLLDDLAGRRGHRPRNPEARPALSPRPGGSAHQPAAGEDDGFPVIPLGDVLAPGRRHDPAASADDESAHGASVVDIGRWNPRRPRDKSVSPGGGPDGTQPALFVPSAAEPQGRRDEPRPPQDGEADQERPAASADRPQAPARGGSAARRKGRAQVPSWDEIVFGARPEPG